MSKWHQKNWIWGAWPYYVAMVPFSKVSSSCGHWWRILDFLLVGSCIVSSALDLSSQFIKNVAKKPNIAYVRGWMHGPCMHGVLEFISFWSHNNNNCPLKIECQYQMSSQIQFFYFLHSKVHIQICLPQISPNKCLLSILKIFSNSKFPFPYSYSIHIHYICFLSLHYINSLNFLR
jgi:hypothetical protein